MKVVAHIAGAVLLILQPVAGSAAERDNSVIEEPKGYRTGDYRAPVPDSLEGARVVTTSDAQAIWQSGRGVFIDVMPQAPRPANLPAGTVWRDKRRLNIPGSAWFPDTGYGELAPATEHYLRSGLERVSGGDRSKLLVIYCLRDCWMSWNAAKRAVSWGYTNVVWYPDGTDGWDEEGFPLEECKAEPRPSE
jgi:PQQ-dependent catabolism-associated CXXCW motif protein